MLVCHSYLPRRMQAMRAAQLKELSALKAEKEEVEKQLKQYAGSDPEALKELQAKVGRQRSVGWEAAIPMCESLVCYKKPISRCVSATCIRPRCTCFAAPHFVERCWPALALRLLAASDLLVTCLSGRRATVPQPSRRARRRQRRIGGRTTCGR
jgi:hypothetical protein